MNSVVFCWEANFMYSCFDLDQARTAPCSSVLVPLISFTVTFFVPMGCCFGRCWLFTNGLRAWKDCQADEFRANRNKTGLVVVANNMWAFAFSRCAVLIPKKILRFARQNFEISLSVDLVSNELLWVAITFYSSQQLVKRSVGGLAESNFCILIFLYTRSRCITWCEFAVVDSILLRILFANSPRSPRRTQNFRPSPIVDTTGNNSVSSELKLLLRWYFFYRSMLKWKSYYSKQTVN